MGRVEVDKVTIEITTEPAKTDPVLNALKAQLVTAKTDGNIKYATWAVVRTTEAAKGTI